MTLSPAAVQALPVILIAFAVAAVVSYVLTPLAIRFAPQIGALDIPGAARRLHQQPIPRTGGLAVAGGFVGVGLVGLLANEFFEFVPEMRAVRTPQVAALLAGVGIGAALGYLDDRLELRARWQLLGQLVLAGIAVLAGIHIDNMVNPLGGPALRFDGAMATAVTTLWIVGMINSANFIDGLDGLLAGIALIAALTLGVVSLVGQPPIQPFVAVLCALLAGSLVGFLPWNFHPARVFIGTAGVFVVGYALAVLAVVGTAKVAVALLVLGVPIIDTFWVIIRRLAAGRAPFSADRGHFHHRLLDLGLSHRQAVVLIYFLCALLAVLSLVLSGRGQVSAFLIIVIGGGLILYLMTRQTRDALDPRSYPDDELEAIGARSETAEAEKGHS
ncbi:MAG: undecaprenyl/decaprenyl-phosphate alpha-N-acetylglucosaminyl 1-phosphate transferase [Chloroflexota bacterium]|nr:undecaprenyl/decaprenyl-phosphate alpha-N-acetylglucosaminyl 1-phosphate transferase [Chloroflexota bacterium]